MRTIKEIPDFDRPREKLALRGPEALSDTELLAILLGSGVKGKNVFQVASTILKKLDMD
jgi:DNA repair protein RadC